MIGFGNDELAKLPRVKDGDLIKCPHCGAAHPLECATENGQPTDLLMFYTCGDKLYMGAVAGRLVAKKHFKNEGNHMTEKSTLEASKATIAFQCGNCFHWQPVQEDGINVEIGGPKRGLCFGGPPQLRFITQNGKVMGQLNMRPVIAAAERGCGSFLPSEGLAQSMTKGANDG